MRQVIDLEEQDAIEGAAAVIAYGMLCVIFVIIAGLSWLAWGVR